MSLLPRTEAPPIVFVHYYCVRGYRLHREGLSRQHRSSLILIISIQLVQEAQPILLEGVLSPAVYLLRLFLGFLRHSPIYDLFNREARWLPFSRHPSSCLAQMRR